MKNFRIFAVLLAMLIVCEGLAFGSPSAVLNETQYNAGGISEGTVILHDFAVENTGSESLKLEADDCGCGGVRAKTPSSIKPGESDVIKVKIPTQGHKGNYRRDIKIKTNDPNNKEIVLIITANINEILSIKPQFIDFGRNKTGTEMSKEIVITNNGQTKITIKGVRVMPSDTSSISPSLEKTVLEPNEQKTIVLKLIPGDKKNYIKGEVVIKTDMNNLDTKNIYFRAEFY